MHGRWKNVQYIVLECITQGFNIAYGVHINIEMLKKLEIKFSI